MLRVSFIQRVGWEDVVEIDGTIFGIPGANKVEDLRKHLVVISKSFKYTPRENPDVARLRETRPTDNLRKNPIRTRGQIFGGQEKSHPHEEITHSGKVALHDNVQADVGEISSLVFAVVGVSAVASLFDEFWRWWRDSNHDVLHNAADDMLGDLEFTGHLNHRQVTRIVRLLMVVVVTITTIIIIIRTSFFTQQ